MARLFLDRSVFRTGLDERSGVRPLGTALLVAVAYVAVFSVYIVVSGRIAESISGDLERLADLERVKGLAFVAFTGLAWFLATFLILKRIRDRDGVIIAQYKSLVSSEPLVVTGLFSSAVCHDINNLLMVVEAGLASLREARGLEEVEREDLARTRAAVERLEALVRRMTAAARGSLPGQRERVDLCAVVRETADFARVHETARHCRVELDLPRALYADVNAALYGRALMNMILNAAEATGGEGRILVRVAEREGQAVTEVHDDGPGIAADLRERILEPFFTSKPDGNGLGLLSLKICAEQHGGRLEVGDSPLGGALFGVALPLEAATAAA